jgi:hypothetical protein
MEQYLQQAKNEEVRNWINVNLRNYLKDNHEVITEVEHIIDYLNSDKAPNRLRKMSYEEAKGNAEKWTKSLIKRAADIVETEQDVEVAIDFKNGVKLVKLVGKNAFLREGKLMRHCVASYYDKDGCSVYSLRDASNRPHCTIEVQHGENDNINQIKGKGNGCIHPRYIKYVLKILKHFKIEVRDSEMSNLGYNSYEHDYLELLDKCYGDKIKYIMFNNKKYVYEWSIR